MSAEPAAASGPYVAPPRPRAIPRYGAATRPLGDPTALACTIAKTAVEVVLGGDGLHSLLRWVASDVCDSLAAQQSLARRAGHQGFEARIERARVCRVSHRAVEVSVVARVRGRALAVAMRFEDLRGRWFATVIEVV